MRIIEGITALCLGSAERLVWVDQTDAAAFCEGESLYLPRPVGFDCDEYGLLLAVALREVSRLWHSDTQAFAALDVGPLAYSTMVEEVRLEIRLAETFRGAPAIFANAAAVAFALQLKALGDEPSQVEDCIALIVWAACHSVAFGAQSLQDGVVQLHARIDSQQRHVRLAQALLLARGAASAASTAEAVELGTRIWELLHPPADSAKPDADGLSGDSERSAHGDDEPSRGSGEPNLAGSSASQVGPETADIGERSWKAVVQRGELDLLSGALAMLRGHPHAIIYRTEAEALRRAAATQAATGFPVTERGQALLAALLDTEQPDLGFMSVTGP